MAEITGSWTCKVNITDIDRLMIRKGPSTTYSIVGVLEKDAADLKAIKYNNGWYYLTDYEGWCDGYYLQVTASTTQATTNTNESSVSSAVSAGTSLSLGVDFYEEYEKITADAAINVSDLVTKSLDGIYGIPYQFMDSVDMTLEGTKIGQTYAEKIVSRMPLLLITPGKVNFMKDYKNKDAAAKVLLSLIQSSDNENELSELKNTTDGLGRYYTFESDFDGYYDCVNAMITTGAAYLNVDSALVNMYGKGYGKLANVEWNTAGNSSFKDILSSNPYVAFYVDSASSAQESFSNTTKESQLASKVNSFSDTAQELQFLLGYNGLGNILEKGESAIQSAIQTIDDVTTTFLNGNNFISNLADNFATVATGGKLIFPEIWSDSSFDRSFSVDIKLRTPDCDILSWFLNIFVPLCHLVCLVSPVQATDHTNGYTSPYLVKGFYKGLFNCNLGILSNLNITKGKESAFTIDGLPTEIDVSFEIKELYNAMSISKASDHFYNNVNLMDYIANTCGININEPDLQRMVSLYMLAKHRRYNNIVPDTWRKVQNKIYNIKQNMYESIQDILYNF